MAELRAISRNWWPLAAVCAILMAPTGIPAAEDSVIQAGLVRLADEEADVRKSGLDDLTRTGDERLEQVLEFYRMGSLYLFQGHVYLCEETTENDDFDEFAPLSDPLTQKPVLDAAGKPLVVPLEDVTELDPSRAERRLASSARFLLRLSSSDTARRLSGAKKCGDPPYLSTALDQLAELAEQDPDPKIRYVARESMYLIHASGVVEDAAPGKRTGAVQTLGDIKSLRALPRLEAMLKDLEETEVKPDGAVDLSAACLASLDRIRRHQAVVSRCENVFQGLSLGSVLVLMGLGLAVTFGLMGVINMAHGELMMIGAYATYEMQLLFMRRIESGSLQPSDYDWYYVLAFPAAFLAAALVGLLMEVLVVRHLYRRPLESLLATWGIGLVLIQAVRIRYGDNIGVNAPEWARGSVEIVQDVNLPYARLFILVLCAASVALIYGVMNYTRVGLRIRATMQNRDMAQSLGVNTLRVDCFTFAFGAGLAGIAGYAWTLIGGVTPDMGQTNFIVDSFLVVVVGGVGELIGVICSGFGIGLVTKAIEPFAGTVWAKIILLVLIVMFIQFKPAGLFAPKGRLADG